MKRIIICEEEAEIIRYAFTEYSNGVPKIEIAESLNNRGYRYRGKPFRGRTFDNWFVNRKYTGEFYFGGRLCTNMYPAIIDKTTFEAVQRRLTQNRYFAGGAATAKEPYLLTGKLFCGECGTAMVSDGGTSKTGIQYHYYACKREKKHRCSKRREHKNLLEKYVTSCVVDYLSDPKNMEIAIDDVLRYYEKRTDMDNLKSINAKIAAAKKEVDELADAFVKAKSALLQNTIETKMQEYETLLNDLELEKAKLELERGYKVTKDDLVAFIAELVKGDVNDKAYQKTVIDHLISQVFVGDDHTVVYFNIRGGKGIETVSLEETQKALDEALEVQMHSAPACHKTPNHICGWGFYNVEWGFEEDGPSEVRVNNMPVACCLVRGRIHGLVGAPGRV